MRLLAFASTLALFLSTACGGNVVVDSGGGAGGASSGGTLAGGAPGSGGAGGGACDPTSPMDVPTVPATYKGCSADGDCTTANISSCCTDYLVGVALDEVPAFDTYQAACIPTTSCACPAGFGGTVTEDGSKTSVGSPATFLVRCTAGLCDTFTTP